jgi:hypothetical protein
VRPPVELTLQPLDPDPLVAGERFDYADRFTIALPGPDRRSAETWARDSLEDAPPALRRLIRVAHRDVLRFRLAGGPGTVVGWRVVTSAHDVVQLCADGPLVRGVLIGRRPSDESTTLQTYLHFHRPWVRFLWSAVQPVHRRVAVHLLRRTAKGADGHR